MKLETIFRAALNDMANKKATPHCGPPAQLTDDPLENISFAEGYAEPGYDNPDKGVVFANWNRFPKRLADILSKAGYGVEWEDEWSTCDRCNKAVRTEPNCYEWKRSYIIYEYETVCRSCTQEDVGEYEQYLLNNQAAADVFSIDWSSRGFVMLNQNHHEFGLHPGQNDTPEKIIAKIPKDHDFLFAIPQVSQFYVTFDCWVRPARKN